MSTAKKPKDSKMSAHDAAAAIISTAIGIKNETGLNVQMRNIPGRGFAIVITGWQFDGQALSRIQAVENLVASTAETAAPG